jgi:hypothetical protein
LTKVVEVTVVVGIVSATECINTKNKNTKLIINEIQQS